jgi:hypothetical protein
LAFAFLAELGAKELSRKPSVCFWHLFQIAKETKLVQNVILHPKVFVPLFTKSGWGSGAKPRTGGGEQT